MSDINICDKCGQQNPAGTAFCIHCGMPMFDLEDINEAGLEKLLQGDDQDVVSDDDFVSGVCKKCGAILDIAKGVQHVTCPICGMPHEVVMQYGEAMLLPLKRTGYEEEPPVMKTPAINKPEPEPVYQPEPEPEYHPEPEPEYSPEPEYEPEPFLNLRPQFEEMPDDLSIRLDDFQDINIIEQIRSEQNSLEIKQQIFELEQSVRENKALIKQQGTTEGDIRNGVVGLLVCILLGVLAESLLQSRLGNIYEHGMIAMLSTMVGVVWMVWCWFTSRFPTSQEGSRVVKETQKIEAQVRSFKDSIDLTPPQDLHMFKDMLGSIQLPRRKTKKQPPWTCTNCGSKNEGVKRTCTKCGAVHKQPKNLKTILIFGYFGVMGLCVIMLAFTWLFASLFDFLPVQPRVDTGSENAEMISRPTPTDSTAASDSATTIIAEDQAETDCVEWKDITSADVGKTLCVYGEVFDRYQGDSNHYYIRFKDDYVSFRMIIKVAKNALVPAFDQGECVYQTGEIQSYGDLIYMDIKTPVARCSLK